MQMQNLVALKSLDSDRGLYNADGTVTACFAVGSKVDRSLLEQDLVLTCTDGRWSANMPLAEFPPQATAGEAALKLADWMERMAAALREGEYDHLDLNKL